MMDNNTKIPVYSANNNLNGYLINCQVKNFQNLDMEITADFIDVNNNKPLKIEFNPEVSPYWLDLSELKLTSGNKLVNVYVQRGRQPVVFSGSLEKN